MTTAWMERQLYFQPPVVPAVLGMYIRAVDPAQPEDDDGRRWLNKGRNRWMLYRNGLWSFASVLAERGAAAAVGFLCPADDCGNVEVTPEAMLNGHCTRCNVQTGWPA
jgi:hypothetical protein